MNRQIELIIERATEGEQLFIDTLEQIRKNKDIEEWLNVANAYYQKGNYDQADEWFSLAAEQGSGTAALYLGDIYGDKENYSEAAKWYLFAAERGEHLAQFNLGAFYGEGLGVEQDFVEAVKWYRLAAESGYWPAHFNLAIAYQRGDGVKRDYTEALHWFRFPAKMANAEAQCYIGAYYYWGVEGIPQDYAEAVKWFRQAAKLGNAVGQYWLGRCYSQGKGVKVDRTEAAKDKSNYSDKHESRPENHDTALIYRNKSVLTIIAADQSRLQSKRTGKQNSKIKCSPGKPDKKQNSEL